MSAPLVGLIPRPSSRHRWQRIGGGLHIVPVEPAMPMIVGGRFAMRAVRHGTRGI
jgi:hypothetical protein